MTSIKKYITIISFYILFVNPFCNINHIYAKNYSPYQIQLSKIKNQQRQQLIKKGISLVNKTKYKSKAGSNRVKYLGKTPKYLCCSSFVSWCFSKSKITKIDYSTWDFCHSKKFRKIKKKYLIPGDIGLIHDKNKYNNHVGIYIGSIGGKNVWLHCTGKTGNGVVLNNDNRFKVFYRYKGFKYKQ